MVNRDVRVPFFWNVSTEEMFRNLSSGVAGLTNIEARARLKQYGANSITTAKSASVFLLFVSQFKSPITLLLIIASLLSASLGDVTDAAIIIAIVLIMSSPKKG